MVGTDVTFNIIGHDRSGSAAFNKLSNSANRADGAMSKFSAGAMKVAKAGALAAVAVGGVAVKLGYDAVMAASDLNETLSKSQVIFGKHADSMASWAARADQSMGLSQQAALNAATGFGDMFSQIGFTNDQAVKMSKGVVQLSADLGSFNNLETADVAERMSAAFRGEFDSLQALIPNINAARVQTEALRMTGKKSADQLTAQEKAAATLAIVTKDGARAQGDFARTSDGLANQTKILKAQLDNASASFGQKLLPLAVDFAQFANRELVPAIEKGAEWLGERLPGAIDTVIDAGKDMRKAVAPAVEEIVEALGNLADEGDSAGKVFNNVFLPALSGTADVVAGLVDFIDDLPGPVKEFGAQAAVAAFALSKLNSAMLAVKGSAFVTTMMDAEKRTASFGRAAKGAAGTAGLVLLAQGFQGAKEDGVSFGDTMGLIAGGAGIGAMFGPIGALVGAGAGGGLAALMDAFGETEEEARRARLELARTAGLEDAKDGADKLAEALNGVVNAYGDVSRAAVEASFIGDDGKLDADVQLLRDLGVSMDTIVAATLGQKDAQEIASAAFDTYVSGLKDSAGEYQAVVDDLSQQIEDYYALHSGQNADSAMTPELEALQTELAGYQSALDDVNGALDAATVGQDNFGAKVNENTTALHLHRDKLEQLSSELGRTVKQYKEWPATLRTEFESKGLPETSAGALRLIDDFKVLQGFKEIKTLAKLEGVTLSERQILKLQERYGLTDPQIETLMKLEGVTAAIAEADRLETRLNNVEDEQVSIWVTRRNVGGGGPTGGGPDLGLGNSPRLAPRTSSRFAASFPTSMRSASAGAGSVYAASPRRMVVEVHVVGELDTSKAKAQLEGIATEVFAHEFQEERRFERTQR